MAGGGMITVRKDAVPGFRVGTCILLCVLQASTAAALGTRPAKIATAGRINARLAGMTAIVESREASSRVTDNPVRDVHNIRDRRGSIEPKALRFIHLTTNDGLSQNNVKAILQDRRGFMWFATQDGLDRYDGNAFVVYKHDPNDPGSLSANLVMDFIEDDQGYIWIATYTGGVDKFDPRTERFTRYRHDPGNPNSIGADSVNTIARDSRGYLWFGTEANGLDKFDPATGRFTHYLNDSEGLFVGRITHVIADRH